MKYWLLLGGAIVLSLLECLAYTQQGYYSLVASRVWVGMGVFYACASLFVITDTLVQEIQQKKWLGPLCLFATLLLGVLQIFFSYYTSYESILQSDAAIKALQQPDWNYIGTAFIGYPSRQYLVTIIPTLLFGKSLLAIRFDYAIPFLLGVCLLYVGLSRALQRHPSAKFFPAIIVLSLFSFPYVTNYFNNYEQVILPISFTMQAIGWLLIFLKHKHIVASICLMWIGSMLATSYTPGIASWLLLLVVLITSAFQTIIRGTKQQKNFTIMLVACILLIATFGALSFLTRDDMYHKMSTVQPNIVQPNLNLTSQIEEAFAIFLFSDGHTFQSLPLALPLLLYMLASVLWMTRKLDALLVVWSLIVIALSSAMKGYATPSPDVALHRAMISIPVLLTGLALYLDTFKLHIPPKAIYAYLLIILIFSLWNISQVAQKNANDVTVNTLENILQSTSAYDQPLHVYIHSTHIITDNISTALSYFLPNSIVSATLSCPTDTGSFIYFTDTYDTCLKAVLTPQPQIQSFIVSKDSSSLHIWKESLLHF